MDHHAGMNVFGHSFRAKTPDFFQHATPEQSTASGKKRTVMSVTSRLKHSIEERLLIFENAFDLQILLKDVRVVKVMGCLDKGHLLVLEQSNRVMQEIPGWHMIHIEYRNYFPVCVLQRMVQISSF